MDDTEYIAISALQHFSFCRRQCALIHIEQAWQENYFTAAGRVMHEHVHEQGDEKRFGKRIERGLALASDRLCLTGKADVVEFGRDEQGGLTVFPVEYKRGKPKIDDCDLIQLTAQALCLEEMTGVSVPKGAVFYGKTWHRHDVDIGPELRQATEKQIAELHGFIREGITPSPVFERKCKFCSLADLCLPVRLEKKFSIDAYLEGQVRE